MKWSLSEFLNLLELRSQCWCFVDIGPSGGFRIPRNEAILFYAVLDGTAKIAGATAGVLDLQQGDIIMVLSGDAHAVRSHRATTTKVLDFLHTGEYVDVPPTITMGRGRVMARVLCGRLKVRWPGAQHPPAIPTVLRLRPTDGVVNFQALERAAKGSGAAAVLTRAAMLLFTLAFRDHPECELIFRDSGLHNPIARARQFIQTHPFQDWTVERIARKVGMGRSNFAARFVAEVGRTPIDVLTEERMKHAANFLEQTGLKIAEISQRIGYRSEAAFSRRFTAYFGMSPGKMRKKWRQAPRESPPPPTASRCLQ
jgi:AraC-like DNA-binding protein